MIVAKNVTKTFPNKITALDDISFHIAKGESVGLLGANGAGKTTLLRLICGMYVPTSGFLKVYGENPFGRKPKKDSCIGFVAGGMIVSGFRMNGESGLLREDISLWQNMECIGNIYRLPGNLAKNRAKELTAALGILELMAEKVGDFSLGQRMRAELAATLLFEPSLLLLDEPFVGVDVIAKEHMQAMLGELKNRNQTTLILTTHHPEEVEKICERVIILEQGKTAYDGSPENLKKSHLGTHVMRVAFEGKLPDLSDIPVNRYVMENHVLTVFYDSGTIRTKELAEYLLAASTITDMTVEQPTLEELLREINRTERKGGENESDRN